MPRGPRIVLDNACYHIINRGNQKQRVFKENPDFEKYLEIMKSYKYRFRFKLFGYCLMPNHIHLIIQPRLPEDLARLMQSLTQTYTVWFNKKYGGAGRVWQGRFKSMVINRDNYFIDCINYVEVNPVRARLVTTPADYLWSSYKERVFGNKKGLLDLADST
jgi:putative transposase